MASEQCVRVIRGYAASVYDVDWSPDSSKLVSGGTDLVVTLWDLQTGTPVQLLQEHISVVYGVGWSPDGRWLASSETEYGIRLWDLHAGTDFRFLRHPDTSGNYFYGLAWNPDSRPSCQRNPPAWRHGLGCHRPAKNLDWTSFVDLVSSSRLESRWRTPRRWGRRWNYIVWNVEENILEQQLIGTSQSESTALPGVPMVHDWLQEQAEQRADNLFVWDLQSGKHIRSFVGHVNVVAAVAWELSGERIISGGGQGILRWWDVESWRAACGSAKPTTARSIRSEEVRMGRNWRAAAMMARLCSGISRTPSISKRCAVIAPTNASTSPAFAG